MRERWVDRTWIALTFAAFVLAAPVSLAQPVGEAGQPDTAASAPPAGEPDALAARLDEIDERLGEIRHLRARFRQKRTIPMLRRPMESGGTVIMLDGSIRWDTLDPAPSTMLLSGTEIRLYYPDSAILEIYDTGAMQGSADLPAQARAGASPRLAQLRERFTLTEIPPSAFTDPPKGDLLGLELTPIDERTASQVRTVRVLIDAAVPVVRRVQITNTEGELTDIELFDLNLDRPVTPEEMVIDVPAGTLISRPMEGDLEDSGEGGADAPGGSP